MIYLMLWYVTVNIANDQVEVVTLLYKVKSYGFPDGGARPLWGDQVEDSLCLRCTWSIVLLS